MTGGETPIRDGAALRSRVASWPAGEPIAVDTEFVRERTYYPRLCLVQLATAGDVALVDVIGADDLGALAEILGAPGRGKILHAARQDVEALLPVTASPLAPVFDTQVAASLLGYPTQVGYAELVRAVLGVELAKGHARTDWTRRPLSPEQIRYACDDVRYLPALAAELDARLHAAGRRSWLDEECASLADPALYRVEPADAWRRLKGLERLDADADAAARALAAWREARAQARDLPRGWVLPDTALLALAVARPRTRAEVASNALVPRGTAARAAGDIIEALERRSEPAIPRSAGGKPSPGELSRLKRLQERLAAIAGELGVRPEVLATRRELEALARGSTDLPVLTGWRRPVAGDALLASL